MAKVTSCGSEQRLDDGYELLLALGGVSQQSRTDQDVVRVSVAMRKSPQVAIKKSPLVAK